MIRPVGRGQLSRLVPGRLICRSAEVPTLTGRAPGSCVSCQSPEIAPDSPGIENRKVATFGERDTTELLVIDEDNGDLAARQRIFERDEPRSGSRNVAGQRPDIWLDDFDPGSVAFRQCLG